MSEAERLAILLSSRQVLTTEKGSPLDEAAAELRRLQAENLELRKDAELWRYSVAIGPNQTMNWLDVYDDWDGDGEFTDAISAAKEQT